MISNTKPGGIKEQWFLTRNKNQLRAMQLRTNISDKKLTISA